jgi:aminopeptidase-like protein
MYCVEVAPHRWTVNLTDGKCDLVDAKEKNGLFIANIHDCELDEAKKVVEICPVKVIKL